MPASPALYETAPLATMGRLDANSAQTPATGVIYAVRCRPLVSIPVTTVRIAPASGTWTITNLAAGLWDAAGVKLAETADFAAGITNGAIQSGTLTAPLTLDAARDYFLGVGFVGSSMGTIRGAGSIAAVSALGPQMARIATGWAGGALPALAVTSTGILPWIDLS